MQIIGNQSLLNTRTIFTPKFDRPMQKINRLKEILNERSLTNSWLAQQLGVNPLTVSKWCTNSSQPDVLFTIVLRN